MTGSVAIEVRSMPGGEIDALVIPDVATTLVIQSLVGAIEAAREALLLELGDWRHGEECDHERGVCAQSRAFELLHRAAVAHDDRGALKKRRLR